MIIVSFYCDIDGKTFYSDCSKKLKANCDRIGVESIVVEKNYGTNWIDNVRAKPIFIKEMLQKLRKPLICLDVDCEICNLDFEIEGNWGFTLRSDQMPCDFVHYVDYNHDNLIFIDRWIAEIGRCGKGSHAALQNIYSSLNYFFIPEGHFNLHLVETESKSQYFRDKWKSYTK